MNHAGPAKEPSSMRIQIDFVNSCTGVQIFRTQATFLDRKNKKAKKSVHFKQFFTDIVNMVVPVTGELKMV